MHRSTREESDWLVNSTLRRAARSSASKGDPPPALALLGLIPPSSIGDLPDGHRQLTRIVGQFGRRVVDAQVECPAAFRRDLASQTNRIRADQGRYAGRRFLLVDNRSQENSQGETTLVAQRDAVRLAPPGTRLISDLVPACGARA